MTQTFILRKYPELHIEREAGPVLGLSSLFVVVVISKNQTFCKIITDNLIYLPLILNNFLPEKRVFLYLLHALDTVERRWL